MGRVCVFVSVFHPFNMISIAEILAVWLFERFTSYSEQSQENPLFWLIFSSSFKSLTMHWHCKLHRRNRGNQIIYVLNHQASCKKCLCENTDITHRKVGGKCFMYEALFQYKAEYIYLSSSNYLEDSNTSSDSFVV